MSVVIETTLGDLTVDLFVQQRPQASNNFLKLCKLKYYNFCSFHFVQRDFIAQTGDPTNTGTGGQSAYAQTEAGEEASYIAAETKPKIKHDRFGLISMVNNGQNGHGSQFFFTLCHSLDYLDGLHTVFGQVAEGSEVLLKLNDTICDEKNRPYQDILITHTVVLDDPFPDIEGLIIPVSSPDYKEKLQELLNSDRIGIGEDIVDEDKPAELIEEELRDKDAKQRALVLEMVGDIPDADMAPPENILFVCKLNPVTREEDLEIIFSRFGRINSCEIIKDEKSQESLQYGFIEFDKKEDCEQAYFKMDNVLIDDRRIHVDFSQSVSKIKWRGKGKGVTLMADNSDSDNDDHHQQNSAHRSKGSKPSQPSKPRHYSEHNSSSSRHRRTSPNTSDRHRKDSNGYHPSLSGSSRSKRREASPSPVRKSHHSSSSHSGRSSSKHARTDHYRHQSDSRRNHGQTESSSRYDDRRPRSRSPDSSRHGRSQHSSSSRSYHSHHRSNR